MDERVIDIAPLPRWMLINLIIAPFRSPKSAKEYEKLWTPEGSPLLVYGKKVEQDLQTRLGDDYKVVLAMRYQNPSIKSALDQLKDLALDEVTVIPLFPQYASASTGSALEKYSSEINKWLVIPEQRIVSRFAQDPKFIEILKSVTEKHCDLSKYDHFVFSYHGLPERHMIKASKNGCCKLGNCCNSYRTDNHHCYRAQCFETTRQLAESLGIPEENYTVSFQSRLGRDPWIKPYTDVALEDLAKSGVKKVLAFSPAFVADCLETTVEVAETYKDAFIESGGEVWDLVPSLNDEEVWIDYLKNMVLNQ